IPAAMLDVAQHPSEQLRGLACQLHPQWADELRRLTGIDTGFRRCGGLHIARTCAEAAALAAWAGLLQQGRIEVSRLSLRELADLEPGLTLVSPSLPVSPSPSLALLLPSEAQLRNPRHLKALLAACQQVGVTITPHVAGDQFVIRNDELAAVNS